MPDTCLILDNDTADFITHHVSINVASVNRQNIPSMARAYGCQVAADRTVLSVMVLESHSKQLLADLRETGRVAIVVSNPSSHKSIQLKGHMVSISPLDDSDRHCIQQFMTSFIDDLKPLGYSDEFCQAIMPNKNASGMRIQIQPTSLFIATPGPKAGSKVSAAS